MRQRDSSEHSHTSCANPGCALIHFQDSDRFGRETVARDRQESERVVLARERMIRPGQLRRSTTVPVGAKGSASPRHDVLRADQAAQPGRQSQRCNFLARINSASCCFLGEPNRLGRAATFADHPASRISSKLSSPECGDRDCWSKRSRTITDFDTRRSNASRSIRLASESGSLMVSVFTFCIVRQERQVRKTTELRVQRPVVLPYPATLTPRNLPITNVTTAASAPIATMRIPL